MLKFFKILNKILNFILLGIIGYYFIHKMGESSSYGEIIFLAIVSFINILSVCIIWVFIDNYIYNKIIKKPKGQIISDIDPYGEEDWTK